MDLTSISVRGLRSLALVKDFRLDSPTVLTGPNDAGKSSLVLALRLLLTENENKSLVEPSDLTRRPDTAPEIAVAGTFALHAGEQEQFELPTPLRLRRRVRWTGDEAESCWEIHRNAPDHDGLARLDELKLDELRALADGLGVTVDGPANAKSSWLRPLRALATTFPHTWRWMRAPVEVLRARPELIEFCGADADSAEGMLTKSMKRAYHDVLAEREVADALAHAEKLIKTKLCSASDELCRFVEQRQADLGSVELDTDIELGQRGFQRARLSLDADGTRIPVTSGGTGTSRRVALAVWEWETARLRRRADNDTHPRPVVVTYDEPDTHLDYHYQRAIMRHIHEQCDLPNVRMLVATHSMNLIDGVELGTVARVELRSGLTHVERLAGDTEHAEIDSFVRDMASSLGLRNSVLLNERCFVGVEGATEMRALPVLFRLHTGMSLQSAGLAMWDCGGNSGALRFAEFLAKHGRTVAFVVDRDSTHKTSLFTSEKMRAFGLDRDKHCLLVGEPEEFEDVFSDQTWSAVAEQHWPRHDDRPWTPAHVAACRARKKFSAAWQEELRTQAGQPLSKPEIGFTLARSLTSQAQIPGALAKVFDQLMDLAGRDATPRGSLAPGVLPRQQQRR